MVHGDTNTSDTLRQNSTKESISRTNQYSICGLRNTKSMTQLVLISEPLILGKQHTLSVL